jgi:pimeloyl-ACP methyl ester carboxylesterase
LRSTSILVLFTSLFVGCASVHIAIPVSSTAGYQLIKKSDANGVFTWAILPSSYSANVASPWIIYDHGFGQTIESILQDNPQSAFVKALASAGFVVVASEYRDLACWGNGNCAEDIANLQTLWRTQLNLSPKPFVIGESMGGIVTWNAISHGSLKPAAVVGIYPVCNLAAMDQNSVFIPTIQSAFGFTSQAGYFSATEGYDPMLTPPAAFTGFPIIIWSSYADHVVVRSLNEDPFARAIRAAGGDISIHASHGEHGDPSNFDAAAVTSFFKTIRQ